jgi:TetR/AcrR family transcriptional repressor of nem operon
MYETDRSHINLQNLDLRRRQRCSPSDMQPTGPRGAHRHCNCGKCIPGPLGLIQSCLRCEISEQAVAESTSRGGGSVRKGEATRQDIIRKAAPIFNRKGYSGAALSDLMRATGLEKGGIYRHFESKEELAGDAFEHAWKVAMDARFEGTEEIPNTVDRLKQIVRNFRDRRAGLVPGGCPLLNTAIDSDDGNPQLRAKARQALSSLIDRLQSVAEEGQRRGEVRGDVDSAKLATLIASTLEGSIMVSRLQKKEEPRDLAVRHLEEYLETKVRARKSKAGADKP